MTGVHTTFDRFQAMFFSASILAAVLSTTCPAQNDIYERSPDVIAPFDSTASPIFTYMTGPSLGGIRAAADSHKVMLLGIGLEQIKKEVTLDSVLARTIRWMTGPAPESFEFFSNIREFSGQPGDIFDHYVDIVNTSRDSLNLYVIRTRDEKPNDSWFSAICLGELCFSPVLDTISTADFFPPLAPGDTLEFHLQVGTDPVEAGQGRVSIKVENQSDPNDAGTLTFTFTTEMVTAVATGIQSASAFALIQNYPNPFNPETRIRYILPAESVGSHVTVTIYNHLGQKVRTLVDKFQSAGAQEVVWNGMDDRGEKVASGIYYCRLQSGSQQTSKKMVLMR